MPSRHRIGARKLECGARSTTHVARRGRAGTASGEIAADKPAATSTTTATMTARFRPLFGPRGAGSRSTLLTPSSFSVPLTHSRRPFTELGSRRTRLLTASANDGESSAPPQPSSWRSSIVLASVATTDRQRPQRSRCRRTRRSWRPASSCSR